MSKRQATSEIIPALSGSKSGSKKQRLTGSRVEGVTEVSSSATVIQQTPPRRQSTLPSLQSPSQRGLAGLRREVRQSRVAETLISIDNIDELTTWLRSNSNKENSKATPAFNFQGIVVGNVRDSYNDRQYDRLFLWGGSATESEAEEFIDGFSQLLQDGRRPTAQKFVLTLTVWGGLDEDDFNNGDRVDARVVKNGMLYQDECPQGFVSNKNSIVRQ